MFDTRDLDVELALHVVQCTTPVELPFPFLTIEALVELTGIPAEDFLTYARNFNGEGYDREASQRGVIVPTPYGHCQVLLFRENDEMVIVQLPFGKPRARMYIPLPVVMQMERATAAATTGRTPRVRGPAATAKPKCLAAEANLFTLTLLKITER